jgi:hypothetical protein
MFPARFPRLFRALDVALEFATLGELRLEDPPDAPEEPAAGRPEVPAAAEPSPGSPPPFPPSLAPATAAGRHAVERLRLMEQLRAIRDADEGTTREPVEPPPPPRVLRAPTCRGDRRRLTSRASARRRYRGGAVEPPEQPCLWTDS